MDYLFTRNMQLSSYNKLMISRYIKYSSRFGNLVILFLFTIDIGRSFAGKHNLSNISDTKMSYQAYLNIAVLVTYIANR